MATEVNSMITCTAGGGHGQQVGGAAVQGLQGFPREKTGEPAIEEKEKTGLTPGHVLNLLQHLRELIVVCLNEQGKPC